MAKRKRQVVMAFDARLDQSAASLRGGKGAHLVRMQSLGFPVPPGFTITTTVTRAVAEHGIYPKRFSGQLERELRLLEKKTGKRFGDPQNPLLLSVRSGAEVSMPGMMDTVLNLGMNEAIRDALTLCVGSSFAESCYARLVSQMGNSFTSDPREQLQIAIDAVFKSWWSERAVQYRRAHDIPDHLGTAVTVQAMVFGNRDERSGTGVVFSRDPNTGRPGLYGEFLPCAQGEDIVSGAHTPMPIFSLAAWNAELYQELARYTARLEDELDAIADVEFTIESGTLYLLQCRKAKLSAEAAATFAVHRQWERRWSREQALASLTREQLKSLEQGSTFSAEASASALVVGRGIPASPGAICGRIARTSEEVLSMKETSVGKVVLLRRETRPEDFQGMLAADAIVTLEGGATSHAAVVARQLGKPAVVGTKFSMSLDNWPPYLSVCGSSGTVYAGKLAVIEPVRPKEVNILLKWSRRATPEPRIDFASVQQTVDVRYLLIEVYLSEAMAHAARGTVLEEEVLAFQRAIVVGTAERFACYLSIAVASELRHLWGNSQASRLMKAEVHRLSRDFGIARDHNRGGVQILSALERMSRAEQADFFALAKKIFACDGWSRSYGGEKWAEIAEAGRAFLTGAWPHAVFVDRVFDLRHNSGRVFDKHSMISCDSIDVDHLLDAKLRAKSPGELFRRFRKLVWDDLSFSGLDLWRKGHTANLWKE